MFHVEEGLGVSTGTCVNNPRLVALKGVRFANYSSGRGTSGGPVFTIDDAGIHLGSNATLGEHPNIFVPGVVVEQLLRYIARKGFNRVVSKDQLSEVFADVCAALDVPEDKKCVGPLAEAFVPNNVWSRLVSSRRGQFRKIAAARVRALAYAGERGEDPEYDPDSPFTEDEEDELWGLVQADIHDKFYGDSCVPEPSAPPPSCPNTPNFRPPPGLTPECFVPPTCELEDFYIRAPAREPAVFIGLPAAKSRSKPEGEKRLAESFVCTFLGRGERVAEPAPQGPRLCRTPYEHVDEIISKSDWYEWEGEHEVLSFFSPLAQKGLQSTCSFLSLKSLRRDTEIAKRSSRRCCLICSRTCNT